MGFRFHKSISIIPGIRVNVSKTGMSVSVGSAPLTVNVGKSGTKVTTSIPGTGLSWSKIMGRKLW